MKIKKIELPKPVFRLTSSLDGLKFCSKLDKCPNPSKSRKKFLGKKTEINFYPPEKRVLKNTRRKREHTCPNRFSYDD